MWFGRRSFSALGYLTRSWNQWNNMLNLWVFCTLMNDDRNYDDDFRFVNENKYKKMD